MARRRRTSPAEDLMDLIGMLPWWAGVALAVVAYVMLHHVAGQAVVATARNGQIGDMLTQTLFKTLASYGQYVVPLLCLAGAGMSAWRRRERRQLVENAVRSPAADALDGMSWQQFEQLVGEAFRLQGYKVVETGGGGADGGVDLVLNKDGDKHLVQCKQWRAFRVGVDVVRELYGVMAARGAAGGFIVTSGKFTEEATSFAQGRNVKLIDGGRLHGLLRSARTASKPDSLAPREEPIASSISQIGAPACPVCSKPMQARTAKRGSRAGGQFWGCGGYPACRGTRPMA